MAWRISACRRSNGRRKVNLHSSRRISCGRSKNTTAARLAATLQEDQSEITCHLQTKNLLACNRNKPAPSALLRQQGVQMLIEESFLHGRRDATESQPDRAQARRRASSRFFASTVDESLPRSFPQVHMP